MGQQKCNRLCIELMETCIKKRKHTLEDTLLRYAFFVKIVIFLQSKKTFVILKKDFDGKNTRERKTGMKKIKAPKIKLPKIKQLKQTAQQKKKMPIILGIVAVVAVAGFTIKHIHDIKVEQANEVVDQIFGEGEYRGNPYVEAEYHNFKKKYDAVADKKSFHKAIVSTLDEFTAVSLNNALYADEQEKKAKMEQKRLEKEKEEQEKTGNKPVPKDSKEAKDALQLMQDSRGREHDFAQVAAVLPDAVGILVKEDYISGDLYNSFANFYGTYSTYIMDKYAAVPQEEKNARYKYNFATKMRNIIESLENFNKNAGEFYHLEGEIVCTPAQVASLYEQSIQMCKETKDGATLALILQDIKDLPYMKDKVSVMGNDMIQEYIAGAVRVATLQNGVGGYYDDPVHREELQAMRSIPYNPESIHGDFYYAKSGKKTFALYRGTALVNQKIDNAIENHLVYALEMPDGSFMFIGKDKIQFTSDIDIPLLEGNFANEEQQIADFYAKDGLPKPAVPPQEEKGQPAQQPMQQPKVQQAKENNDARSVQQASAKYRGEVVGRLDSPNL